MKLIMGKVEGYIKEYGYYEDMKDANGRVIVLVLGSSYILGSKGLS
jgi:hypothetical protein